MVPNPDGTYTRTLDEAGVPTPFMSFPDVNWGLVPGDVINALVKGFQKRIPQRQPDAGGYAQCHHRTAEAAHRSARSARRAQSDILNGLNRLGL